MAEGIALGVAGEDFPAGALDAEVGDISARTGLVQGVTRVTSAHLVKVELFVGSEKLQYRPL